MRRFVMKEKVLEHIVPYSASYYLRAFKQLDETGQCDFNWSAAIFGPFWALYRKIYLGALLMLVSIPINVMFALDFLVVIYKFVQRMFGEDISAYKMAKELNCFFYIGGAFLIYQALTAFLYGKYGNKLYYKQVKKRIFQGYHLVTGISATMSPFVVVLILTSLPILSGCVISAWVKLLRLIGIHYDSGWITVCFSVVIAFSLVLAIYSKLDALVVKKFKKSHEITNTEISEENIIEYLTSDGINPYFKILNIILFVVLCGFIWMVRGLVNYIC